MEGGIKMMIITTTTTTTMTIMKAKGWLQLKLKKYLLVFMLCNFVLAHIIACAKAGSPLNNLLKYTDQDDSLTSVNKAGKFSDQQAGYFTGGSIIHRGPKPKTLQPITVQPPSFKYDACTGSFDARFGGFSYINHARFTEFFKATATSVGGYAAKMLIKEACPQCENIISDLEAIARDINGLSINQCALAQNIASGGLNILNNARKQQCMMSNNLQHDKEDMFAVNQGCIDDPNKYSGKEKDPELASLLGDNFNLVWKALSQGEDKGDEDLKSLMMSITGSIIGINEAEVLKISTLPSLIEKEDLLERYIGGAGGASTKVKLYKCDEAKLCLKPTEAEVVIENKDTIYGKVSKSLSSLFKKIDEDDGKITDDEQALIEYSSIPLVRLMEMELVMKNKESAMSLIGSTEFIDVVCHDMVANFMQKMLEKARAAVDILQTAQLDNTAIERFMANIEVVRGYIRDKRYNSMQKLQMVMQVKQQLVQQEKIFKLQFSRYLESSNN